MKIIYFTFNEPVNGVYISQVIDVVRHFKTEGFNTQIIAIFSIKNYWKNRKTLKKYNQSSISLPAFPKLKNWPLNGIWLRILFPLLTGHHIICRGPIATNLAIKYKKNATIIYDGRGAIWAEQKEYGVFNGSGIENQLFDLEKKAVLHSHKQIAVSSQLVEYWRNNFGYTQDTYRVIPCTLSEIEENIQAPMPKKIRIFLHEANKKNHIILVFSGGNGKWQQIEQICQFVDHLLKNQSNISALFLTPVNSSIKNLSKDYPDKILNVLVKPRDVYPILKKCDYGIVLREQNITNKVASPVKVAEYLFAGLKVIISPNLGDYSEMIAINNLGFVLQDIKTIQYLPKPNIKEKEKITSFAKKNLMKSKAYYRSFIGY